VGFIAPPALRIRCQHDNPRCKTTSHCLDVSDRLQQRAARRPGSPAELQSYRALIGLVDLSTWLPVRARSAVPAPFCYVIDTQPEITAAEPLADGPDQQLRRTNAGS
jgi:hypothetical protein